MGTTMNFELNVETIEKLAHMMQELQLDSIRIGDFEMQKSQHVHQVMPESTPITEDDLY